MHSGTSSPFDSRRAGRGAPLPRWAVAGIFVVLLSCVACTPETSDPGCAEGTEGEGLLCAAEALPSCSSSVGERPRAPKPTRKNSDDYRSPDNATRAAVEASVAAAFRGDGRRALAQGRAAGYTVCRDGVGHLRWTPGSRTPGGAAWLVDPDPAARAIVLEAPHSYFDRWTLDLSADLRERINARVLLVSGTHRCGSDKSNICSGKNHSCGDRKGGHRISDPAHDVQGTFHAAHKALVAALPSDVFVSVHGMPGDGVSISDGTTDDTADDSRVARLGRAFLARFPNEEVTACNRHSGARYANRMCGTRNVQGRQLNGSSEPCTAASPQASGRFVHLELSKALRKQPDAVAAALAEGLGGGTPHRIDPPLPGR